MFLLSCCGVNVGGNNIIKMSSLKTSFEMMGFSEVSTTMIYTQILNRGRPGHYQPGLRQIRV